MKRYYSVLALLLCAVMATANEKLFRLFDVENGLPESQVRCLSQLPDGRIFVLTEGMANVYDGSEFRTFHFKPSETGAVDYSDFCESYVSNDGKLWIRRLNTYLILDLIHEKFIETPDSYIVKTFGIHEKLRNFFIDSFGAYWFFTRSYKLYRYDSQHKKLLLVPYHFSEKSKALQVFQSENQTYVLVDDGKVLRCDSHSLNVLDEDDSLKPYFRSQPGLSRACSYKGNFYLICSNEHNQSIFLQKKKKTRNWEVLYTSNHIFTSLTPLPDGQILVGGEEGVLYFNQDGSLVQRQSEFQTEEGRIIRGKVVDVLSDKQGGIWLASNAYGLLYHNPYRIRFNSIPNVQELAPGWKGANVTSLLPYNDNEMLVGTTNGVFVYHRINRSIRVLSSDLSGLFVLSLTRGTDGLIWIGTIDSGCYRLQEDKIRNYRVWASGSTNPVESNIRGVYDFPGKGCWLLGRFSGAGRFDAETGNFYPLMKDHPELKAIGMVTHVIPWEEQSLLFASQSGLFTYNVATGKVSFPTKGTSDDMFNHSNRKYNCVMQDSRGWVWFGTQDGLNLYIPEARKNHSFYMEDGLVNNSIRSVIEDKEGYIWVATSNGLSRFVLSTNAQKPVRYIQNFDSRSGLLRGEYQERASCLFPDGTLYLGGLNGISELLASQMKGKHEELKPLFSSLKVQGKEVQVGDAENPILTQSLFATSRIELSHRQNTLSLDFSSLNFANPEQTHYRYRLEGSGNPEWTEVKSVNGKGTVHFTSLPSGRYHLVVYAAGGDYQWGDKPATLDIIIHPPFYLSAWSITGYILVLFILVVYLWLSTVRRKERQMEVRQEKERLRQEEGLNQMKYRFITNMSHELRTPLTLIVTPLEHLMHTLTDETIKSQLKVIAQGAAELRGMINQLLDFRRIEMKGEKLNPTYNDVSDYLQTVHSFFLQLAHDRGMVFNLNRQQLALMMWYDKEKLQKILYNLLSNAFKFTPAGGVIDLRQTVDTMPEDSSVEALRIEICDTGCGIPAEDLPHIFERFYQGDNQGNTTGSGVGLHLTMEYVRMHGGVIEVESQPGKGSCFIVWIPMKNYGEEFLDTDSPEELLDTTDTAVEDLAQSESLPEQPLSEEDGQVQTEEHRLTILLVDDNDSLLQFIAGLLAQEYRVITAADGLKGHEQALNALPDMIISDVMMPGIDGFELCRRLRNDIRTSHIPVILLTAKGSDEDQISGYKSGADAYIAKPFNYEILQLRVRRIFGLLDKRRKDFRDSVEVEPEKITISKLDEELIARAMELVMKNLDNSEYTVEQFSRDMNMDRTGLYRKLLSVVGLTPVAFIRSVRMKEAAKLLKEGSGTISEVAYRVGYSTPRYFSKHFVQEFGVHPSDYLKSV